VPSKAKDCDNYLVIIFLRYGVSTQVFVLDRQVLSCLGYASSLFYSDYFGTGLIFCLSHPGLWSYFMLPSAAEMASATQHAQLFPLR
jgi:hypothetical protein